MAKDTAALFEGPPPLLMSVDDAAKLLLVDSVPAPELPYTIEPGDTLVGYGGDGFWVYPVPREAHYEIGDDFVTAGMDLPVAFIRMEG